jgi:YjbE family integral membrane protein
MELKIDDVISIVKIIIIDLLLSGDNAIVIAMATLNLNPKSRRKGILFGTCGAITLRVLLASVAAFIFQIPFLQLLGGLVLIWITVKLLVESSGGENKENLIEPPGRLLSAIKIIIIADFSMSMDNVLAISSASHGNVKFLIFGLLFSIPILILFSKKIAHFMDKYPLLISAGGVILSLVAGEVIFTDKIIAQYVKEPYDLIFTILITIFVLVFSKIKMRPVHRS